MYYIDLFIISIYYFNNNIIISLSVFEYHWKTRGDPDVIDSQ